MSGRSPLAQPDIDRHSPHFFVQMGWSILRVDSQGITSKYLLRGEITPCTSTKKKENIKCIPEAMRIPGSEELDHDRYEAWAYYVLSAYDEANRLMELEASSERRDGLVRLKTLSENSRLYEEFDFNDLFYPQGLANLPERSADLREHLEKRILEIQTDPTLGIQPYKLDLIVQIGRELVDAVKVAEQIQGSRLRLTHLCMKLPPKEEGYKREYDQVDMEMLKRTGEPEINEADRTTARALEMLAGGALTANNQSNDALIAMVQAQREQNEIMAAMLKEIMTERQNIATQPIMNLEVTQAGKPVPKPNDVKPGTGK